MDSIDKTFDTEIKSNVKRLPPLVLPNETDFYSHEFQTRLKYFTASSNAFKWDQTNINSKTKKFLTRNGFNSLFWSAIVIDESIIPLVMELFADNIKFISDEEFEPTFGISLMKSAEISSTQLLANYFLLFGIPAKSYSPYLNEWTKGRLDAFYRTIGSTETPNFDSHPELFVATKRRFYVYKHLVPALILYAIDSCDKRTDILRHFFHQIKIAISYSGLKTFYLSSNFVREFYRVFDLTAIKDDVNRMTAAKSAIIEKYGEERLPFARLLNYPEVEGLNHRHYPDLAFCGHYYSTKSNDRLSKNTWNNMTFKQFKTKTPRDELKRLTMKWKADGFNLLVSRYFT